MTLSWRELLERLRQFAADAQRLRDAHAWPWWVRLAAMASVFGLVLGLGYAWFLTGGRERLASMRLQEQTLRQAYERKAAEAAKLPVYRLQQQRIEAAFATLVEQLPGDAEVPDLLEDITRAAAETELVVRSIDLQPERQADFYLELPARISVEGSYHDIGAFVSRVASLPRIVTLHDFDLAATEHDGSLRMNILAKTYRYVDQPEGTQ